MNIVLWGAGKTLHEVIDDIDTRVNKILFIIDSDKRKNNTFVLGLQVKHYSEVDLNDVDVLVITTRFKEDVKRIIKQNFASTRLKVFQDTEHFLAYEYRRNNLEKTKLSKLLENNNYQYKTDKRLQYLEIYERYFESFVGTGCTFVEAGVYEGGSLDLWKDYFSFNDKIVAIDINGECKKYERDNVIVEIGSQESDYFWNYFERKYRKIDIFLDDGGHTMKQQIKSFLKVFPMLSEKGIYMCEDVFTSYWREWGGGENSFINFIKGYVDSMNYIFAPVEDNQMNYSNDFSRYIKGIHFYPGIVVIEKGVNCRKLDNRLCSSEIC